MPAASRFPASPPGPARRPGTVARSARDRGPSRPGEGGRGPRASGWGDGGPSRSVEQDDVQAVGELAARDAAVIRRAVLGPVPSGLGTDPEVRAGLVDQAERLLVVAVGDAGAD